MDILFRRLLNKASLSDSKMQTWGVCLKTVRQDGGLGAWKESWVGGVGGSRRLGHMSGIFPDEPEEEEESVVT